MTSSSVRSLRSKRTASVAPRRRRTRLPANSFRGCEEEEKMYKKVNGRWVTADRQPVVEEKKKPISSDLVQEMLKK